LIESHKDTINSIRELYIAYVSLQMNDTIKTLTIFSVILLPLTFITGFYGMNGIDLTNFFSLPWLNHGFSYYGNNPCSINYIF
jgi:magnesium transporter